MINRSLRSIAAVALLGVVLAFTGCHPTGSDADNTAGSIAGYTEYLTLTNEYPHSTASFTQGLFFHNGQMYESVGKYGESAVFKSISPETGEHEAEYRFADDIFAEGSVVFNGKLYVLTWKESIVSVFNPETLEHEKNYPYNREGWGLTTDGEYLIASDGTASICFMDADLNDVKTITVTFNGEEIPNINELEYINGYIWANVWLSDEILIIDPQNGDVISKLDFGGLYEAQSNDADDVMNGIAFNPETGKIYITGKRWDTLYEFELKASVRF